VRDITDERSMTPSTVVAQYEKLRMAALGEPLAPEDRNGLVVFLRRGMWGWARALATVGVAQPARSPSSSSRAPQSAGIVHVFAAMALACTNGSTS
jgi:hypothetical protein